MNNIPTEQASIIRRHQKISPVNVVEIAHDLKIKVFSANGDENLSGKIIKTGPLHEGECSYSIFVNNKDKPTRQRFTIAHEIAHFLLHKNDIGDGIVEDALYRSGLSYKKEVEANKLAADILMPWNLIYEAMNNDCVTISKLAKIFQVSESAMSIRLGVPS